MDKPRISVLIPCYNREKYIQQCVKSVIDQSYENLEIIICDNASTDQTYTILKGLASKDSRIRLSRNEKNIGPIPNWRKCLEQASGEYIHWMWSDDYVEPRFYECVLNGMAKCSASMALASHKMFMDVDGRLLKIMNRSEFDLLPGSSVAKKMLSRKPPWTVSPAAWLLPSVSVRSHFFDRIPVVNGLDCVSKAIGIDLLMIVGAAFDAQQVVRVPEACAVFRSHAGSISIRQPTWRHYEAAKIWFILKYRMEQERWINKCWLIARALRIHAFELAACLFSPRYRHARLDQK